MFLLVILENGLVVVGIFGCLVVFVDMLLKIVFILFEVCLMCRCMRLSDEWLLKMMSRIVCLVMIEMWMWFCLFLWKRIENLCLLMSLVRLFVVVMLFVVSDVKDVVLNCLILLVVVICWLVLLMRKMV